MELSETAIATAEAMFVRVTKALCHRPDLLHVEFVHEDTSLLIDIVSHPTDARIIIGHGGKHIAALANLARLLFRGSGKLVNIAPVASLDGYEQIPYIKLNPSEHWNKDSVCDLLKGLTELVFAGHAAAIEESIENAACSRLVISLTPGCQDTVKMKRFNMSINILFIRIGVVAGRFVYASLRKA